MTNSPLRTVTCRVCTLTHSHALTTHHHLLSALSNARQQRELNHAASPQRKLSKHRPRRRAACICAHLNHAARANDTCTHRPPKSKNESSSVHRSALEDPSKHLKPHPTRITIRIHRGMQDERSKNCEKQTSWKAGEGG